VSLGKHIEQSWYWLVIAHTEHRCAWLHHIFWKTCNTTIDVSNDPKCLKWFEAIPLACIISKSCRQRDVFKCDASLFVICWTFLDERMYLNYRNKKTYLHPMLKGSSDRQKKSASFYLRSGRVCNGLWSTKLWNCWCFASVAIMAVPVMQEIICWPPV